MVELIYNGETKIKIIECEEFLNILKQYRVASKEHVNEAKEESTSKTNYENIIKKHENEIRSQKQEIIMFQKTFMQMKADIYKMRAENKDKKGKECNDQKDNEKSKKRDSETQTEAIPTEKELDKYGKTGKEKFQYINCKYFYKGEGCKRGSYCWFSHDGSKTMEMYCPYWVDGRCRYAANFCRSGCHGDITINQ